MSYMTSMTSYFPYMPAGLTPLYPNSRVGYTEKPAGTDATSAVGEIVEM